MPNEQKKILLVSYDLSYTENNYKELFEALKSESAWWHYLDSTWLVLTTKTPRELADQIRPLFNQKEDTFLVIEVTSTCSGWLPRKAWEWIKSKGKALKQE